MKKIGILGGTFNPIHHGHLILGQAAKEEFGLDEILVMPTKNPAYKKISGGVSEKNRVDMIKLAIRDFPYFKFSDRLTAREVLQPKEPQALRGEAWASGRRTCGLKSLRAHVRQALSGSSTAMSECSENTDRSVLMRSASAVMVVWKSFRRTLTRTASPMN